MNPDDSPFFSLNPFRQQASRHKIIEDYPFMANHGEIVSFIWSVADLIRDSFKRGHYQDVILPFTVLRRIDSVLAPNRQKVHETYNKLKGKLENLDPQLCKASGFAFYNTSKYNLRLLHLDGARHLALGVEGLVILAANPGEEGE